MNKSVKYLLAVLGLMSLTLLAGCAGGSQGLTEEDVRRLVHEQLTSIPPPTPSAGEGVTAAEVDQAIAEALADVEALVAASVPDPVETVPGVSAPEAERIARRVVASVPPRSAAAEYTKHMVASAIQRYEDLGLEATVAHYNRRESVDGQWYVFIIGEDGLVAAHHDPGRLGLDVRDWVGIDANGYRFGPELMSTGENGKWVSYVYRNPASGGLRSGDFQLKNVWVMRHAGLLFASGWYIEADDFTRLLVEVAVEKFEQLGLQGTVAYFASPGTELAGLEKAIDYYNAAQTVDGRWMAFIADPSGLVLAHSDPSMIGRPLGDVLGTAAASIPAAGSGRWLVDETARVYVAESGSYLFGSGWRLRGGEN